MCKNALSLSTGVRGRRHADDQHRHSAGEEAEIARLPGLVAHIRPVADHRRQPRGGVVRGGTAAPSALRHRRRPHRTAAEGRRGA